MVVRCCSSQEAVKAWVEPGRPCNHCVLLASSCTSRVQPGCTGDRAACNSSSKRISFDRAKTLPNCLAYPTLLPHFSSRLKPGTNVLPCLPSDQPPKQGFVKLKFYWNFSRRFAGTSVVLSDLKVQPGDDEILGSQQSHLHCCRLSICNGASGFQPDSSLELTRVRSRRSCEKQRQPAVRSGRGVFLVKGGEGGWFQCHTLLLTWCVTACNLLDKEL